MMHHLLASLEEGLAVVTHPMGIKSLKRKVSPIRKDLKKTQMKKCKE